MSDCIKREDVKYTLEHALQAVMELIQDIPSADVVEVVRCKDCKWWNGNDCESRDIDVVDVDDYCSYGERKDDND